MLHLNKLATDSDNEYSHTEAIITVFYAQTARQIFVLAKYKVNITTRRYFRRLT